MRIIWINRIKRGIINNVSQSYFGEKSIKRLIIGILLVMIFTLQACTTDAHQASYEDFDHIEHWDDLSQLEGEHTIIYYYSPYCDICINLEQEVSGFLYDLKSSKEVFLIDAGMIFEQGEPDFHLNETVPALIIFKDQVFQEWIIGSRPVTDYLKAQLNE